MVDKVRFAFTEVDPDHGALSTLPYLPLILTYQNQSLSVSGLLDTGSSVNVLPYDMGLRLGTVWERQRLSVPLAGNLARFEARAFPYFYFLSYSAYYFRLKTPQTITQQSFEA